MLRPEDCKPGTLVECIDDSGRWSGDAQGLRRGAIYTIERLEGPSHEGEYGIAIAEIRAAHFAGGFDTRGTFNINRFRLLPGERLAVFQAMLEPKPVKKTEWV